MIPTVMFPESVWGQATPDSLPTTGREAPALLPFDDVVRDIIGMTGAPGAALAVAREGRLVLARGYGYAVRAIDSERMAPCRR